MTTITNLDLDAAIPTVRVRSNPIVRWFKAWHRYRTQRLTLQTLSRMDEHLLRDMGISPADISDALNGRRNASALFDPVGRDQH